MHLPQRNRGRSKRKRILNSTRLILLGRTKWKHSPILVSASLPFPSRHKGIRGDAYLDLTYPHRAVVPWERCCEKAYEPAHSRAHELGSAERRVTVERYPDTWLIFRFSTAESADVMAAEFGGKTFDARQRGTGPAVRSGGKRSTAASWREHHLAPS